jgi:hypothetical protein
MRPPRSIAPAGEIPKFTLKMAIWFTAMFGRIA